MNTPPAKLLVLVGDKFSCVKIIGRANFTSSIDFKTLLNELREKGYKYFILELSECVLMDSTFLGVLAGFGLKMSQDQAATHTGSIELLNPTPRVTELLENLGVLHLFKLSDGPLSPPQGTETRTHACCANPSKEEVSRACLEAHRTLMEINPDNVRRFKDVTQFLAQDLKKLKPSG
jgi:anti-anti-sigma regulatory factor